MVFMSKEAVITGIGVVTPAGIGIKDFWNGVLSAKSSISPITRFDTTKFLSKVGGTVPDFDPVKYLDPRILAQTDRWTQFDLISTKEALANANLDLQQEDLTKVG